MAREPRVVLYVANAAKIGGGNRVLMELMRGLDPSRFTPVLVSPEAGPLVDWASAEHIPCLISAPGDWSSVPGLLRRSWELAGIISRTRASIVHAAAPMCYRALGLAGRLTGAFRVCHLGFPPEQGELQRSFTFGPDVVIGCYVGQADDHRAEIAELQPRCRTIGIPNGVDTGRFCPGTASPAVAALRGDASAVIAILGHISDVKGYPTFVDAAAAVAQAHPGCAFWAIGGETTQAGGRAAIEARASALGIRDRLRFLGHRSDVHEVLKAVDMVALPSLAEGFPLAVLEAMAAGIPVIATPVGGVPEAMIDGETGSLVPPQDAGALAAAMTRLLDDQGMRIRMGRDARTRALQYFSIVTFVQRIQDTYDAATAVAASLDASASSYRVQPRLPEPQAAESTAASHQARR